MVLFPETDFKNENGNSAKRRVCFVITSKIHYARNKKVMEALRDHPGIELQIVVGGSALLEKYGNAVPDIEVDGFKIDDKFYMTLEGGGTLSMAKSSAIGLSELATIFNRLNPDVVLLRGDRYEVLSAAIAAAYLNITIAHIEGGDITGTIDESVRHAVTKLSHIHFPTNKDSAARIIQMGEDKNYVFDVGSPELELVAGNDSVVVKEMVNYFGVGANVDIEKPFVMVMQHSVTTELLDSRGQIEETLNAVNDLEIPAIWFWPNADAGGDDISKGIRAFRENYNPENIHFLTYRLQSNEFYSLLRKSSCLVGNSSAGLKEAGILGVPVVNIGTRQSGRYIGPNVVTVPYERKAISAAIDKQVKLGKYEPDYFLYKKDTSKKIADILATVPLYTQKQFVT